MDMNAHYVTSVIADATGAAPARIRVRGGGGSELRVPLRQCGGRLRERWNEGAVTHRVAKEIVLCSGTLC
jgi:hypothetical protein